MKKKQIIAKEIKDQIIDRIKNQGVSVSQAATEHGISTNTIVKKSCQLSESAASNNAVISQPCLGYGFHLSLVQGQIYLCLHRY